MKEKVYACIDLKSFYASVECVERGLDPFRTNLVVADASRGRGTICLAVSPALKNLGVRNRCRLFEIPKDIEYIAAMPRMKKYMEHSAEIYSIYLRYIAKEDIHVYSIDECFFDFTPYLKMYGKTPREIASMIISDVQKTTGICATAGIGTNLFLAKVALDITAKHAEDFIGELDEEGFKKHVWHHRPITDIWNVGQGVASRLARYGVYDLYGVTLFDEKFLYKEFGSNAEYLIDHAHGREPCTMEQIHSYKSKSNSLSNGQILFESYEYEDARLVAHEMLDQLVIEMVEKGVSTNSISIAVGYEDVSLGISGATRKIGSRTKSFKRLLDELDAIFDEVVLKKQLIRRINISLNNLIKEDFIQFELFRDNEKSIKEESMIDAVHRIKTQYGKNAILRGISLEEKATARARNKLIGGHNAE